MYCIGAQFRLLLREMSRFQPGDYDVQSWRGTNFGMDSPEHFHFETGIDHSARSACLPGPEEPENNK